METIKCGTLVVMKLANIQGMITCVSLRFDRVIYEVTYYVGAEQETIWVNENEFDTTTPELIKIGFKK